MFSNYIARIFYIQKSTYNILFKTRSDYTKYPFYNKYILAFFILSDVHFLQFLSFYDFFFSSC